MKTFPLNLLRAIALAVTVAGAGASLWLMISGRNTPLLLLILFIGWVLAPYIALFVANVISKRWSVLTRVALYILTIILTIGSLVSYSGALSPPDMRPAFMFLVVPLISLLLIAIELLLTRRLSRRSDSV